MTQKLAAWRRRLPRCIQPSTISSFVVGGQVMYRETPTPVTIKWQKRGGIPAHGKPANVAKSILSFLGFIVQFAIIGEIDPDTAAKGVLIPAHRFHAVDVEKALGRQVDQRISISTPVPHDGASGSRPM
jgi:hypothetical protein